MDKNIGIIEKIIEFAEDIQNSQRRFGNDYSTFISDRDYYNSVCLCLIQIGELSTHLTDAFVLSCNDIPWKKIVALRNRVVHGYGTLDKETIWATVTDDIPELYRKCKAIIEPLAGEQPGQNHDGKQHK